MTIKNISLFKRYNGIYYIIYESDGVTKWKSTKKKLKHEALQVLTEFEQYCKKEVPKITLGEFVNHFCSLQSNNLRKSTIERICLPAFKAFERICGDKPLSAYTFYDVEHFKAVRLQSCSPTTVNIAFRFLKGAFNSAVRWEFLRENPFLKSSQVRAPQQLPSYLTKEEFKQVLKRVIEPELRDLFLFAALTGMRMGEIINLQWTHLNFADRQILITSSDQFTTKTGKTRIVPMNTLVHSTLSHKLSSSQRCSYVFNRAGLPFTREYVSKKFKRYIRQQGLNDGIHFHSLRHTFATWLVKEGVSIYEIQKLLGHSSVKVTEVYSHLAGSELHATVNRISLA